MMIRIILLVILILLGYYVYHAKNKPMPLPLGFDKYLSKDILKQKVSRSILFYNFEHISNDKIHVSVSSADTINIEQTQILVMKYKAKVSLNDRGEFVITPTEAIIVPKDSTPDRVVNGNLITIIEKPPSSVLLKYEDPIDGKYSINELEFL